LESTRGHWEKKERINEVLRSAFTREEVSEASIKYKQYKEWLTATQEERRERELQDPDTFYPDVSFARYLADLSRDERRLKRYRNLRYGEKKNLVSTRNYLKYCIKNEMEAVNTKFLDRDFKPIIRARLGHSTKMYRKGGDGAGKQLGPSTVQQLLSKKFNELRKEIRATELIEYKKEITGMKEFSDEDVLYCSERVQRKVLEIAKQQEVKVIQERVKELMLEPWKTTKTP